MATFDHKADGACKGKAEDIQQDGQALEYVPEELQEKIKQGV
jgi:hypothetical protein